MAVLSHAPGDRRPTLRCVRLSAASMCLAISAGCAAAELVGESERIAEALGLAPGMQVADVGAGGGTFTEDLASRVGETGHVYATEIDEDDLGEIRRWIEKEGLGHVTAILGEANDTGLPEGCCDAILLRLVYHHFTDPEPMRLSLHRALRPGAVMAVIDIVPQTDWRVLPGVPDRGGHGIAPEDLIAELTAAGFDVVERYDEWPSGADHYCVVFRRR